MNKKKNIFVVLMLLMITGFAYAAPGEITPTSKILDTISPSILADNSSGLQPMVSENGKISWSIDAVGENTGYGFVSVQKPSGATVRGAYLMAASTGSSQYHITNSDIMLAGSSINFSTEIESSIGSFNYFADVTSLMKPLIDSSSAGITNFTVNESNTFNIDGVVLVVIFDDPNQVNDNTIFLAFGAQNTLGDSFNIGLADAIDTSEPGFLLDMSLGISYGFQPSGQYSQIDVNGQRLTTSAGGQDDGESQDGALITAGGIDDNSTNPADPNATDGEGPRYDDELYNIVPFVDDGNTTIAVDTLNPSDDDNIFFAGFFLGSTTAVVGEGIVLSPQSAINNLNTKHIVTAKAQYSNGSVITGTEVLFEILSGPNAGLNSTVTTDINGQATWSYTGLTIGNDTIRASFKNAEGNPIFSNVVSKEWKKKSSEPPVCIPDLTVISGTVYINNATASGKEIKVTCTHAGVDTVRTLTTLSDGTYQVTLGKDVCDTGDNVVVEADGTKNSGSIASDCKLLLDLILQDVTIPEFGSGVAVGIAIIGAMASLLLIRKREE